jgi:hypothetical protein
MTVEKLQFKRTAGPTSPAVSLAEIKADLRVFSTYFDELILSHIEEAISLVDGPQSGLANRCLGVQTYEVYLRTGLQSFEVPIPDGVELVSAQLIDGTDFSVSTVQAVALFHSDRAIIRLAETPYLAFENPDAPNVKLVVRMGLSPVPPIAKNAIKMLVRSFWAGDTGGENEKAFRRALGAFRITPGNT